MTVALRRKTQRFGVMSETSDKMSGLRYEGTSSRSDCFVSKEIQLFGATVEVSTDDLLLVRDRC
jgi:hypothetical protein